MVTIRTDPFILFLPPFIIPHKKNKNKKEITADTEIARPIGVELVILSVQIAYVTI